MADAAMLFVGNSRMWEMYASMARLASDNDLALPKRVHMRVTSLGSRGVPRHGHRLRKINI